jgi:pyridoxal phosphate enzyme (YggS family)
MRCSQSAIDVQERAFEIEQVCTRYREVRSKVRELGLRHHGSSEAVALLLASKRQPAWILGPLAKEGARLFGENYVQEARAKMAELQGLSAEWHLIGTLQANKAKKAIESFSVIQTLDTIELAQRLNSLAEDMHRRVRCLIEVNIGAEPTKAGVFPGDLMGFLEKTLSFSSLEVLGLMAIPPLELEIDASRRHFERMYGLFQGAKDAGYPMHWLSMGTSHDFEQAIGAGANMVRVGTRVFGPRQAGKLQ